MRLFIRGVVVFLLVAATIACVKRPAEDLTLAPPYAAFIGAEYRVAADLHAYGIYDDLNKKSISHITLIPGIGVAGPEVAFRRLIGKGQVIKIHSAWRERKLLRSDVYYVVSIEGNKLLPDVPIQLELSRGNEGSEGGLNPSVYEALARRASDKVPKGIKTGSE